MSNKNIFVLGILSLFTLSYSAFGQDSDNFDLEQVVVSAAGYEQYIDQAPASISVVSYNEFLNKPVQDVSDIIDDLPGVNISKSIYGVGQVGIRGFSSKYTAILVDGRRQNNSHSISVGGLDPNGAFMPPKTMIKKIEVIRGPSSSIYGSDAIGGIINIITKQNPDKFTGTIGMDIRVPEDKSLYSNTVNYSGYVAIPIIKDKLSLSLRGRSYNKGTDHLRQPDGNPASHSVGDYSLDNIGGRINYTFDDKHSVYFDGESYYLDGATNNIAKTNLRFQRVYVRNNGILNYQGSYDFGDLNTYLQYNETKGVRQSASSVPFGPLNSRDMPTLYSRNYIAESRLVSPFDFGDNGMLKLTTGIQFWHERYRNDSGSLISKQVLIRNSTSLYAEGEYMFTEKLTGTIGTRYNYTNKFGSYATPRVYLVYQANDIITYKGGVSTGYFTPSIPQASSGRYSGVVGAQLIYGNPNLKPEKSTNYEFSTIYNLKEYGNLTTTAFYTDFKDKIINQAYIKGNTLPGNVICEGSECYFSINASKSHTYGLEILYNSPVYKGFSFQGSYTYTYGKVTSDDQKGAPLTEVPRHMILGKVNYNYNNFNFFVKYTAKFKTPVSYEKIGPGDYYNNYQLFDLGCNYDLMKKHHFAFVVNNLFNKDFNQYNWVEQRNGKYGYESIYADHIYGRTFWFSYNYSF